MSSSEEVASMSSSSSSEEEEIVNGPDLNFYESDEGLIEEEVYMKEWILSGDANRKVYSEEEIEQQNWEMFWDEYLRIEPPPGEEKPKPPRIEDVLFEYMETKKKLLNDKAAAAAATADLASYQDLPVADGASTSTLHP